VKTAVSLPDELFERADRTAKRLGLSRSELYARAIAAYLEKRRGSEITAALDRVYGDEDDDKDVDPVLGELQRRTLARRSW
jgi:predicted transcriptional regulator